MFERIKFLAQLLFIGAGQTAKDITEAIGEKQYDHDLQLGRQETISVPTPSFSEFKMGQDRF